MLGWVNSQLERCCYNPICELSEVELEEARENVVNKFPIARD